MNEKLVNFRYDEDSYHEFKKICMEKRLDVKVVVGSLIDEYIEKNRGKEQPTIDQFATEDFMVYPSVNTDMGIWNKFMNNATSEQIKTVKGFVIGMDRWLVRNL